ncbi:MAG: TOBE domain-containing protein [Bauldia sp.]|nr:TOBE domain-containing protein [Bauldia sp.]
MLDVGGGERVAAEAAAPLAAGTVATLSVRPEAISVQRDGAWTDASAGISGPISEIIYLGSSIRIGCLTAGDVLLWADLRDEEAAGLAVGTDVRLTWAPTAATAWAGDRK